MFGGKYKWMWTVAKVQVEEVVADELPPGLRELRPAIWDDVVARAKAGNCYYPIQDKSGVWRNYHYYSTGTFVPPSSHSTYELMVMEGTMKGKPVDEKEFQGSPGRLAPGLGRTLGSGKGKRAWMNTETGQLFGLYFMRDIPQLISLANGGEKIDVETFW